MHGHLNVKLVQNLNKRERTGGEVGEPAKIIVLFFISVSNGQTVFSLIQQQIT